MPATWPSRRSSAPSSDRPDRPQEYAWSAEDTTPAAIERALGDLLVRYHARVPTHAPARALTLLVIVDPAEHAALERQLTRVARRYASRTVVCLVKPGQQRIDATARLTGTERPPPGAWSFTHEHVLLTVGERHLAHLDSILRWLLLRDVPALVWSPAIDRTRLQATLPLAEAALLDTVTAQPLATALPTVCALTEQTHVVDLAWLRSVPWRERVAALFDPPSWRARLEDIDGIQVRHHPRSQAVALLLVGWLASRLGWTPQPLAPSQARERLQARATSRTRQISVRLDPASNQTAPGLAGITITTRDGTTLSLDRGPGGLHARHVTPAGTASEWTLLGASRGEPGILRDGVREALLRDPTYRPALHAAAAMLPSPCPQT